MNKRKTIVLLTDLVNLPDLYKIQLQLLQHYFLYAKKMSSVFHDYFKDMEKYYLRSNDATTKRIDEDLKNCIEELMHLNGRYIISN